MSSDRSDDDRKLSYDGQRGPLFRAYRRDVMATARGMFAKDDRYSYFHAFKRIDEGGTGPGAPARPCVLTID